MRVRIAFRNTVRNKRRTALSVLMIAGGVSAIILFRGFAHRILFDLRETTIRSHIGHAQIATQLYWQKNDENPKETLIDGYAALAERVRSIPHVAYAAGRLSFFGLISSGDKALSARGLTIDPVAEKGKSDSLRMLEGVGLSPAKPFQIIVGSGLAKRLKISVGSSLTVLSYTYDSVVNALDMEVAGVFHAGVTEIDDTTFILSLESAQRLLDTDKVEQIIVGLDDTDNVDLVMPRLNEELKQRDARLEARPWLEFASFYKQAASFFRTQNQVIEAILLSLVLLGVLNTIGMSVMERAGEVGTVRALGDTEGTVISQFILEGAMLGGLGAVAGCLLGTALALLLNYFEFPIVVPGATLPLKVKIDFLASAYREAILLAVCAATAAALFPAIRASRLSIVEALRRS